MNKTQEFEKLIVDILMKTGTNQQEAAIKELITQTGLSLVDAKEAVDAVVKDFESYKNKYYPNTNNNESSDYDDMSIEEIKKEIEKEKLIAELKRLKMQNAEEVPNNKSDTIVSAPKPIKTKRQRKKDNKAAGIACCPKCGSTSIQATNKKLSIGRAIVGTVIMPGVGTVLGGLSSKKTICTCLNCGHKWKIK